MLAVFNKSVAMGPEELCSPSSGQDGALSGMDIMNAFVSEESQVMQLHFKGVGGMAYTHHREALLKPRSFAVVDDVFCLFEGNLQNLTSLRHEYGLAQHVATEVTLVIEAYKTLRDRGPLPADQVVSDFEGQFIFILYDATTGNVFVAADNEGKLPLYWGMAADGSLAFSDKAELLKLGCKFSFAPFPSGCYFSSHKGLHSFEHPLKRLKSIPRVDNEGNALGATFKVDLTTQDSAAKEEGMHRVESEANWATSI
eukprot:c22658_g1_i1 orf=334-1098(+)